MNPLRIQNLRADLAHVRYLCVSAGDTRFRPATRRGFARDAEQHLTELLDQLYVEQIAAFGDVSRGGQ